MIGSPATAGEAGSRRAARAALGRAGREWTGQRSRGWGFLASCSRGWLDPGRIERPQAAAMSELHSLARRARPSGAPAPAACYTRRATPPGGPQGEPRETPAMSTLRGAGDPAWRRVGRRPSPPARTRPRDPRGCVFVATPRRTSPSETCGSRWLRPGASARPTTPGTRPGLLHDRASWSAHDRDATRRPRAHGRANGLALERSRRSGTAPTRARAASSTPAELGYEEVTARVRRPGSEFTGAAVGARHATSKGAALVEVAHADSTLGLTCRT